MPNLIGLNFERSGHIVGLWIIWIIAGHLFELASIEQVLNWKSKIRSNLMPRIIVYQTNIIVCGSHPRFWIISRTNTKFGQFSNISRIWGFELLSIKLILHWKHFQTSFRIWSFEVYMSSKYWIELLFN